MSSEYFAQLELVKLDGSLTSRNIADVPGVDMLLIGSSDLTAERVSISPLSARAPAADVQHGHSR